MSFQWLQLRLTEEKERREREARVLDRLPGAIIELRESLGACVEEYDGMFGAGSATLTHEGLRVTVACDGHHVDVIADSKIPGFHIQREGSTLDIQVGILPGDRLFYLDLTADQYLSMEEVTRKILDRVLFPKLQE